MTDTPVKMRIEGERRMKVKCKASCLVMLVEIFQLEIFQKFHETLKYFKAYKFQKFHKKQNIFKSIKFILSLI